MNKANSITAIFLLCVLVFSLNSAKSQGVKPPLRSNQWENIEILSSTNALFAVDLQTRKPIWSENGEFYRESFDFDDLDIRFDSRENMVQSKNGESRETSELPQRFSAEHRIAFGRLYAVLDRSSVRPQKGNVLLAFDLTQQGKVVWRLAPPPRTSFQSLISLVRDQLTVGLSNGTTLQVDVATGEIVSF